MRIWITAAVTAFALQAQAAPQPPAPDHPLLGIWTLRLPARDCTEIYRFRADGTTLVFSAAEVSESAFEVDARPGASGYYKLSDRIIKDNGKPDCGGKITQAGAHSTNYIRFNADRTVFVMCVAESLRACIGPFHRVAGQAI